MTVRELAKLVDVSPATVSLVLNGKKGVGDETRKKVLDAVERYHYIQPLRKKAIVKSVLVIKFYKSGIFVEENQGFISAIIDAIESGLRKKELGMTLMVIKKDLNGGLKNIDYSKYHGVIVIGTEIVSDDYGLLSAIPLPFIVVDNMMPGYAYSTVCMNNSENIRLLLAYAKEAGHTRIGFIGGSSSAQNFSERFEAFEKYIREFGLNFDLRDKYDVTPTLLGAYDDFIKIIENGKFSAFPTCFVSANDTLALGVIKALKEKGYKVPADISVLGFDDISYASISSPPLTTVHVQRGIIGKQAVIQLLQIIDDNSFSTIKTEVTGILVVRGSLSFR